MSKSKIEISKIKKSMLLAEKVMEYLSKNIKLGMSEKEIRQMAIIKGIELGADKISFDFIVAAGLNGDSPHWNTSTAKIEKGQLITIDLGFVLDDYCSDITRTFKTSDKIPQKLEEIYNVVLKALQAVNKKVKPGMTGQEVDKIARDIITKAGYGNYFGHGLGHGLGLEIHEEPRFSPLSKTVIKKGMIISNEPGIYIPGLGGVRIEDILLITDKGCEVLNNFNKKLISLNL